jgi:hypothetical protein
MRLRNGPARHVEQRRGDLWPQGQVSHVLRYMNQVCVPKHSVRQRMAEDIDEMNQEKTEFRRQLSLVRTRMVQCPQMSKQRIESKRVRTRELAQRLS